jgi:tRNA pseudouridine38-40 synthase
LILVRVGGSHFIWKMVRRMVGVLVEVGKGQIEPDEVTALMAGAKAPAIQPARFTAPAAGLFLERVFYDGDPRQFPLRPAIPVGLARG